MQSLTTAPRFRHLETIASRRREYLISIKIDRVLLHMFIHVYYIYCANRVSLHTFLTRRNRTKGSFLFYSSLNTFFVELLLLAEPFRPTCSLIKRFYPRESRGEGNENYPFPSRLRRAKRWTTSDEWSRLSSDRYCVLFFYTFSSFSFFFARFLRHPRKDRSRWLCALTSLFFFSSPRGKNYARRLFVTFPSRRNVQRLPATRKKQRV